MHTWILCLAPLMTRHILSSQSKKAFQDRKKVLTIGILQFFLPQEKPERADYIIWCSVRKVGLNDPLFSHDSGIQDFYYT